MLDDHADELFERGTGMPYALRELEVTALDERGLTDTPANRRRAHAEAHAAYCRAVERAI